MPLYQYTCHVCGRSTDEMRTIADRNNGPSCCGLPMPMQIVPPMIAPIIGGGNFHGYVCPVTEKLVTSRKERREIMAEHGLVEAGDPKSTRKARDIHIDEKATEQAIAEAVKDAGL